MHLFVFSNAVHFYGLDDSVTMKQQAQQNHQEVLPQVVFLDASTIPQSIQLPMLSFSHQWKSYQKTSAKQVVERLKNAIVVIVNKVILSKEILSQLPHLRLIAVSATGVNNVDLDACRSLGIAVTNVQGYATQSVPEHVLGLMFALRRSLFAYHQDIARGVWQEEGNFCFFNQPIGDLAGSTLAILGKGSLGLALEHLAKAIGMNVVFAERKHEIKPREGYISFEKALAVADVVSLHCPLTEQTKNLIAAPEFQRMKSNCILINTGRGGLVNEQDLVDALKEKQILGAGVDVFTQEPATQKNPLIQNMHLPNLILTPHVAWGSESAISKLVAILFQNIEDFWVGKSTNRVV